MLKKVLLGIALVSGFSFASTSSICEEFAGIMDKCQQLGFEYKSDKGICKTVAQTVLVFTENYASQNPDVAPQIKVLGETVAVGCYLVCLKPQSWDRDEFIEKCKAKLGK